MTLTTTCDRGFISSNFMWGNEGPRSEVTAQGHPPDHRKPEGDTHRALSPTALSAGMWFSRNSKYSLHSTPLLNPSWPLFTWNQCQANVRDGLLEPEAEAVWLADTSPDPERALFSPQSLLCCVCRRPVLIWTLWRPQESLLSKLMWRLKGFAPSWDC